MYLYNASGRSSPGIPLDFPSEFETYRDVEHAREELAIAPIIGEVVEVDHAAVRFPGPETGGAK